MVFACVCVTSYIWSCSFFWFWRFFDSIEKSKNLLSHGCLAELEANLIHTEWLVPLIKLTFLWVEGSKQVGEIVLCDADDKWRVNVNVKKNCNIWFLIIRRIIQVNKCYYTKRSCNVNLNEINIIWYTKSYFISLVYHYRVTRDFDITWNHKGCYGLIKNFNNPYQCPWMYILLYLRVDEIWAITTPVTYIYIKFHGADISTFHVIKITHSCT